MHIAIASITVLVQIFVRVLSGSTCALNFCAPTLLPVHIGVTFFQIGACQNPCIILAYSLACFAIKKLTSKSSIYKYILNALLVR